MSKVPENLKFASSHEWVRVAEGVATVGISDHAQQELTDIVFVELPAVSRQVEAGEACAVVESVKTASDLYSPVTGQITEVNSALTDNPALVNSDPYGDGWFFKVKLSQPGELDGLMSADVYQKQITAA